MIFWGTVGTIGGLVTRDHYLTVAAKKRVADKVDILAKQPCGVQDMPRKVTVYIMPPPGDGIHKTRHYFKQFVKVLKPQKGSSHVTTEKAARSVQSNVFLLDHAVVLACVRCCCSGLRSQGGIF